MLDQLLRLSLAHRGAVLLAAALVMATGIWSARDLPLDVFPDLTAPRVTVVTEAPGLAAEDVERLVTHPLESAVHGTPGLRRVRSASAVGISLVWAEFDWDTSPSAARIAVAERVQSAAPGLPQESRLPRLAPPSSVMGEIAFLALTSQSVSPMDLHRIAEIDVRRRLLGVAGIAQVVALGGDAKQYQVRLDPARLQTHRLTAQDLTAAIERGTGTTVGGFAVAGGQEAVLRLPGRPRNEDDLAGLTVSLRGDVPVRVRDVAEVVVAPAPRRGTASLNATPAVLISIVKQPAADTAATTARLDHALEALQPELRARGVTLHRDVFRQQDFIDRALANVGAVLRDGILLVVAVLFVFLWSLRPTLVSLVALPLSLAVAVIALGLAGMTLDTMTLGGLAIAIGELVDDAIVDVENVARRLRERVGLPVDERPPVLQTVLRASLEVRSAIASATWVVMVVFVPLLLLEGIEGRLLRPLAVAYLVAILASLAVALTVTPVLALLLLPPAAERHAAHDPPVLRALTRAYSPVLAFALRHPGVVVAASAAAVALALAGFLAFKRTFLPEFNEGSVTIQMVLAPGTALAVSDDLGRQAERALLADPGVASVGRRTGRAEADEHVQGVEAAELEVRLRTDDPRTKEKLFADLRQRLASVPAAFTLGQPISHRIEHMVSGQRTALAVKVFGPDLRELRRVADRAKAAMQGVPGVVDLDIEAATDVPQWVVRPDADAVAAHGWSASEAATAIGVALWGVPAGRIVDRGVTSEVVVKHALLEPLDLATAAAVPIPTPRGELVPVSALASVQRDAGPNYVLRENVERRLTVTANVVGGDLAGVAAAVERAVRSQVQPPQQGRFEFAGQFEREAAAARRLLVLGILSVIAIGWIVARTLGSVRRSAIVLVNLPLALAGGVGGVWLAGGVLSVATTIGFITLFGIATRNGILLATRTRDLEADGNERHEAVARAARERLAPIVMTAATAGLGLLPLAFALGRPGSEIQAPMALVILTGLFTSTALNMVVVPALLVRWGGEPPASPPA
jgi:CzcA family heavy metal efflux pump